MIDGFQRALDHIRSKAESEAAKGRWFERLMKTYFLQDPLYRDRFSRVWLWSDWALMRPGFEGTDTGVDLVAEERSGGYCAIQCKCYAPDTRISKAHLDSFIAASARDPFTSRLVVDTGAGWGPNARKLVEKLSLSCTVLRFGDLADRSIDWPDLVEEAPEKLSFRREPSADRRARGRRSVIGAGRQRAFCSRVERITGFAFARRQVRRRDQQDRPERQADRQDYLQRRLR